MKLHGQTFLITGGGSGIGEALAHRLHDAGNTVIIAGRRRETLEKAAGGRPNIHVAELDVTDPADIDAFAKRIVADFPSLNVLINNAGIMRDDVLDTESDLAHLDATVATNLTGPIRLINALVDHLKTQTEPAIVNVTSGLAFVPLVQYAVYSATKAALHSYTASLRHSLKGKVKVVEIAPPGVQTELTPGQSNDLRFQPLGAFANEVVALLAQRPTPAEVLVEQVKFLRNAESEGRFDAALAAINGG